MNHAPSHSRKSSPPSSTVSRMATPLLRQFLKLLINSVGERDYSAQETCHLLMQLPMFKASRDFIVLSLDGSRAVEERLEEHHHATALSILDHYMRRPNSAPLDDITLLEFARQYTMPKTPGSKPSRRSKCVVVISRPYCSPDPAGPKYEQYCRQSLMQHKSFRVVDDLLNGYTTFIDAYAAYLQSGSVPPSLRMTSKGCNSTVCVTLRNTTQQRYPLIYMYTSVSL